MLAYKYKPPSVLSVVTPPTVGNNTASRLEFVSDAVEIDDDIGGIGGVGIDIAVGDSVRDAIM